MSGAARFTCAAAEFSRENQRLKDEDPPFFGGVAYFSEVQNASFREGNPGLTQRMCLSLKQLKESSTKHNIGRFSISMMG